MVAVRVVGRVLPGEDGRGRDRAVEDDRIETILVTNVAGHTALEVDRRPVQIDRRVLEAGAHAAHDGLRGSTAIAIEVVVGDDGEVGPVQLNAVRTRPEKPVVIELDGLLLVRREGPQDGVVPDRAGGTGLQRGTGRLGKRHRAAERDLLDVQSGRREAGPAGVEHHLDALRADVVHRPESAIGLARNRNRRIRRIDAVEVRGADAAIDDGEAIGHLVQRVARVGGGERTTRDGEGGQRMLDADVREGRVTAMARIGGRDADAVPCRNVRFRIKGDGPGPTRP